MGTRLQMFRISRRVARKFYDTIKSWKIVKGDTVEILMGKDAGRRGTVERVIRKKNKVIVDGLNLVKKHMRKTEVMDGGVFTRARVRVSKRTGEVIPRPELPRKLREDIDPALDPQLDTPAEVVAEATFVPFKVQL